MAFPKVEAVTPKVVLGEGPHWDHEAQVLYFVDLNGSKVCKYNPACKKFTSTTKIDGGYVTFVIPIKGKKDKFAITIGQDLLIMTWDGENSTPSKMEHILTIHPDNPGSRFNDGKADPNGELWAGTMGKEISPSVFESEAGAFYSISKQCTITARVPKMSISNGMAWSKDLRNFYFIDSNITKIFKCDFDAKTRQVSNRVSIFDFDKYSIKGFPDGMTIDTDDKLWVACFHAGEVIRVDPITGELLQKVSIPAPNVTSVTFGGPNLDELYVTTASIRMTPEEEKQFPSAGALFKVTGAGAKGFPGVSVDLCSCKM